MKNKFSIPKNEFSIAFARSGGKGGQNVNKLETKVILRWNVGASKFLGKRQKEQVLAYAPLVSRINAAGEVVVYEQSQRTQAQNKKLVIEKLNRLVGKALARRTPRIATKIPRSAREKQLREKKSASAKKSARGKVREWE